MINSDDYGFSVAVSEIMDDATNSVNRNDDCFARGAGFAIIDRILISLTILLFLLNVGAQLYKLYK